MSLPQSLRLSIWSRRAVALLLAMICVGATTTITARPALAAPVSKPLAIGSLDPGGKVLGVNATAVNSQVFALPWTADPAAANRQRWTFELVLYLPQGSRNLYRIRNMAAPSLCLGVDNAESLRLQTCNDYDTQQWVIPHATPTTGGYRMQIKKGTGFRCLNQGANGVDTPGVMGCFNPDRPTQLWRTRSGPTFCSSFDVTAVCTSYNPPLQGLFGAWRQNEVTFNDFRAAQVTQYVAGRTVNPQLVDTMADRFEIGWRNVYTPGNPSSPAVIAREAYWSESAPGFYQQFSLAQQPDGGLGNGQMHSYLALASANGKVDLLYDYNTVGTTAGSESGRISYLETGLSHSDQGTAVIPTGIEHRTQILDVTGVWRRPAAASLSLYEDRPCYGPSWGLPFTPPACTNGAVVVRQPAEMEYFTVTQPSAAPAPASAPNLSAGLQADVPPTVLNGVDQRTLASCLQTSPDNCLATVPGLAQCVAQRKQCRAWNENRQPAVKLRAARMTAAEAIAAARKTLLTDKGRALPATVRPLTRTMTAGDYTAADLLKTGAKATDQIIVVTGGTRVRAPEPTSDDSSYAGFTLAYHVATGTLLHTCLGPSCEPLR
ncbi:RICIN domain-containing protein [Couchioplanes azureus]|uniref:RICIN domain-containing protein n=1 Tax=Couchioplanes caeruleus TaxID=56438 RepID=UPI0016706472|nr:RICIN domain-containing protein [Couchioplanes caeruleus]GGQ83503.1 hypothetical protein GCM10010166_62060 [Couchioplanes caeruleus subsp. azureus]